MKKIILSLALVSLIAVAAHSQVNFEVPKNVELKTDADFAKYEPAVINAAKWLEATDLDKDMEKRQNVNAFVLQWISGSPSITVDITEQLSKIYGKNEQLLGVYLASYTRYFLENKNSATKVTATRAGLHAMINVYEKGINITKSKEMEDVIRLAKENKLDEYIKTRM